MILRGKSVAVLALPVIPALLLVALIFYGTPASHLRGVLKVGLIWLFVFVELLAIVGVALFLFPSSSRTSAAANSEITVFPSAVGKITSVFFSSAVLAMDVWYSLCTAALRNMRG